MGSIKKDEYLVKSIAELFQTNEHFVALEKECPGAINHLARGKGTWLVEECAGQVMYRQDDLPVNFYAVRSGEIAIYRRGRVADAYDKTPREEEEPDDTLTEVVEHLDPTDLDEEEAQAFADAPITPALNHRLARAIGEGPRYLTSEGHSSFEENTKLGKKASVLNASDIFGEQGLATNELRQASAKVVKDAELIVIEPSIYCNIKKTLLERQKFFDDNFPGVDSILPGQTHPSLLSRPMYLARGEALLFQGISAAEPGIYFLQGGELELRRYRSSSENPAYKLASRPLTASWKVPGTRSKGGLAELCEDSSPEQVPWETLSKGDVICSLAALSLTGEEPFSVVAKESCDLHYIAGADLARLPPQVLKRARCKLVRQLKARLKELPENQDGSMPPMTSSQSLPRLFGSTCSSFGGEGLDLM